MMATTTSLPWRKSLLSTFSHQQQTRLLSTIRQHFPSRKTNPIITSSSRSSSKRSIHIPPPRLLPHSSQRQLSTIPASTTNPPSPVTTTSTTSISPATVASASEPAVTAELSPLSPTTTPSSEQTPPPISSDLLSQLPLLHLQSSSPQASLYATLHLHARPYLVTLGDRIRLPFLMPKVQAGDVLRLTHASTLGTRDYTLKGAPWVDSRLFVARVVVAGVESEPMRVMEKTKRRNRKIKHVRSKMRFTELCVSELRVKSLEEIARDGNLVEETGEMDGESVDR